MMAMTVDGKIARSQDHFPDWTSIEDKKLFEQVSKEHGVVIMGETTFDTLPGPLKDRLNVVFSLKPEERPQIDEVMWVSGEIEPVLAELESMGYDKALLGGGAYMNSMFLEKKFIDEIMLTIEPKIFGEGLSLFSKELDTSLELLEMKQINHNSVVLRYEVIR